MLKMSMEVKSDHSFKGRNVFRHLGDVGEYMSLCTIYCHTM